MGGDSSCCHGNEGRVLLWQHYLDWVKVVSVVGVYISNDLNLCVLERRDLEAGSDLRKELNDDIVYFVSMHYI